MAAEREPATPGELFRQLREARKIRSVRELARRSGVSHTRLTELENATGPENLQSDTIRRIARALSVTPELIERIASGVMDALPDDLDAHGGPRDKSRDDRYRGRNYPVRYLGSVSAGFDGDGYAEPLDYLAVADFFVNDYDPDDVYALQVTGDSMVSDDVRLSIPEGSIILVHKNLAPKPGNVVVVWLEDQERGILKKFKPDEDEDIWLVSYNAKHPPTKITEETPATLRGVMIGHWAKAPGF